MRYDVLPYERIRSLRIDKSLTQTEVAAVLHVKQNTYSQYELGISKYPVEALVTLALFYNTSVDYLLGVTDDPRPYERSKK